ncbi:polyunsaturated fatty acid lipoxygenase ALOX15B-like [Gambusia affinis]|uniref:polyunsaturated fatty acid lipoxygenase ALOX15B-like n=1 Tax=Gambusia affinis TaxID=33528 RepID=UPI001CDC6171|nr:polyunsaturated fatty acid lipoxygenase ALOX15B-like [Gambusia affinis]XP_043971366.1 polyunsaturated fatty acid lipoxygenase ALOX15B-like [Gambusia affinis]XP_043971367.1 polyunsaturated fatty acid lipoxygenase ALOX15B-like [Gambusia affinis]XP_043971368.1 polyunsaturated fatty acid lipoxygenase ALOX15B-like [Gambusia affinis]XP_043971369.1 polyunsaturated fatty acid lipoxygenase ALOX15B-like [Gambusia affinis]XP_043971370.1 polyunsaturated fatty acid lipoxygenase ALOX15B-like [Gambusia af
MVDYSVTIYTGDAAHCSTFHDFYITLVGTDGRSDCKKLSTWVPSFTQNPYTHNVECTKPLGELLVIIIQKEHHLVFSKGPWFVAKVEVRSPMGDIYQFPIYKWITDSKDHYFQEGSAKFLSQEKHNITELCWTIDLEEQQALYCWDQLKDGLPHNMKAESCSSLPLDVRFYNIKELEMVYTGAIALLQLKLSEWAEHKTKWTNIEDIKHLYCCHRTEISDYVCQNWQDDSFFGYQFLNGVNPMMIQCCKTLPENFQVTDEMVFKDGNQSLTDEMKKGNIFLCDYKMLDGVKANVIDGEQQYLVAPLVLLHKTPDDKLMPIAIQLKQIPAEDNPIFLPTDSRWDWLLAKTFVRNADFNMHELSSHLLRTHLLAEVFAVALLRHIPMMHPLYKLLMPHSRYTLMINFLARKLLISEDGVFTKFASSGGEGMITILRKALSSMTYRSLCLPDDISDRGLEDVPNFFYRDDGLKLWNIIYSFVKGTLQYYYKSDQMVQEDQALQQWIGDIYSKGFLSEKNTGIPMRFDTVDELVKFVTMVIFTGSAQHSAVNTGQYDFIGWMPNTPMTLKCPPPSKKGEATEETLLDTLPSIDVTVHGMATVWLLSKQSTDAECLGYYPEQRFIEEVPLNNIKVFQEQLKELSLQIEDRNKDLDLPYTYLDPKVVENSVSV